MKPYQYGILIFTAVFMILACQRNFSVFPVEKGKTPPRTLTTLEKSLIESDNAFGFRLFREIVKNDDKPNIFISPLSVHMALGMTLNGAAGTTEEAMKNTLAFEGMSMEDINQSFKSLIELLSGLDPGVIFEIANSIWYRQGFEVLDDFIQINKRTFDALVRSLDFSLPESKDIINNWVSENTHGKIEEIIDQIDPMTVMFLINAIYFKGMWTYQFEKSKTTDGTFTTLDGSQVPVRMMYQETDLPYLSTAEFQAVDLPYGSDLYSMSVILPNPGVDLKTLIQNLTHEEWSGWLGQLSKTKLMLFMPKFKIKYELKMNDVLKAMGMEIAFSGEADFSGINADRDLFISEVRHKSFIEVDEEGTEAAAVTVVEIRETSIGPYMQIDRPFLFAIREKHSGTVLFIGMISNPALE